jgi:hypothetical protein
MSILSSANGCSEITTSTPSSQIISSMLQIYSLTRNLLYLNLLYYNSIIILNSLISNSSSVESQEQISSHLINNLSSLINKILILIIIIILTIIIFLMNIIITLEIIQKSNRKAKTKSKRNI